jgi:cytochrome c
MSSRSVRLVACAAIVALVAACTESGTRNAAAQRVGNASRGKAAAERYGCNACHAIGELEAPTVAAAPPVTDFAERVYIAGTLPNTPENLVRWIRFPREVKPQTAMPDLAVSAEDARDIAAYLYSSR